MLIVEQYRSRGYERCGATAHVACSEHILTRHRAALICFFSFVGSDYNLADDCAASVTHICACIRACSRDTSGRADAGRTPTYVGIFRLVPGNCVGLQRQVR